MCLCVCVMRAGALREVFPFVGRWHCFNDRIVSDLDEPTVQSANAYLLFYVRRDMAGADVGAVFPRTAPEPVDITKMTAKYQNTATGGRCAVM